MNNTMEMEIARRSIKEAIRQGYSDQLCIDRTIRLMMLFKFTREHSEVIVQRAFNQTHKGE